MISQELNMLLDLKMALISLWIILSNLYFINCEFPWIDMNSFKDENVILKSRIKRDVEGNETESSHNVDNLMCNFNSKFYCICQNCTGSQNCCMDTIGEYIKDNTMQVTLIFDNDFTYNVTFEKLFNTQINHAVYEYCQLYRDQCTDIFYSESQNSTENLNFTLEAIQLFMLDIDFQNSTSVIFSFVIGINQCIGGEGIDRNCSNISSSETTFLDALSNYNILEESFIGIVLQNQSQQLEKALGLKLIIKTMENNVTDGIDNDDDERQKKIIRDLIIMGGFFGGLLFISCFASAIKAIKDRRMIKRRIKEKRRERLEKTNGECTKTNSEENHCNGKTAAGKSSLNGFVNKPDVAITIENGTSTPHSQPPPPYANGKFDVTATHKTENGMNGTNTKNGGIKNGGSSLFIPRVVTIEQSSNQNEKSDENVKTPEKMKKDISEDDINHISGGSKQISTDDITYNNSMEQEVNQKFDNSVEDTTKDNMNGTNQDIKDNEKTQMDTDIGISDDSEQNVIKENTEQIKKNVIEKETINKGDNNSYGTPLQNCDDIVENCPDKVDGDEQSPECDVVSESLDNHESNHKESQIKEPNTCVLHDNQIKNQSNLSNCGDEKKISHDQNESSTKEIEVEINQRFNDCDEENGESDQTKQL